jgi:hypothetical protein
MLTGKRRRSKKARQGERFIAGYRFPDYLWKRVRKRVPNPDQASLHLIERGLREWFICCAWRGRAVLGMPSRLVDEAWHQFILDSITYTQFCEQAFGGYLHHRPDEAMGTPMGDALAETVRAWDRSQAGQNGESILWDLDERLGVDEPLGINGLQLAAARARGHYPVGSGAGCGASGDGGSDGGGCGGGGCGGGS